MSFLKTKYLTDIVNAAEQKVCDTFGITKQVIHAKSRHRQAAYARYAVWLVLKMRNGMSALMIAEIYGFDHSSVLYGILQAKAAGYEKELGINGGQASVDASNKHLVP